MSDANLINDWLIVKWHLLLDDKHNKTERDVPDGKSSKGRKNLNHNIIKFCSICNSTKYCIFINRKYEAVHTFLTMIYLALAI